MAVLMKRYTNVNYCLSIVLIEWKLDAEEIFIGC